MKTDIKIPRRFCTTREAAEMLGVSLKTAQLWSENGLLSAWRTAGGHRRILRESVERLLVDRHETGPAAATGEKVRVLVAESESLQRSLYAANLARWAMAPEVTLVTDGFEALLRIGRCVPDLLIADLEIPDLDVLLMLKRLRRIPELETMAIVAVTALGEDELARRGGVPPDVSVFAKPVPFPALERAAAEIVAARRPAEVAAVA